MSSPPEIEIIDENAYKILSEKNKAYIVVNSHKDTLNQKKAYRETRDKKDKKDITNIQEDDIVGINGAGVEAILNGAVPPSIPWMKHIVLPFPNSDVGQGINYSEKFKEQTRILSELQNTLLEAVLSGKKEYSFKSSLTEKYVWAFEELQKKDGIKWNPDAIQKTLEDENIDLTDMVSVVEQYGDFYNNNFKQKSEGSLWHS